MATVHPIRPVSCGLRLRFFSALLCAAFCWPIFLGIATAYDDTKDPGETADRLAALFANSSNSGPILDRFAELSRGGAAKQSDIEGVVAPLDWILSKVSVPGQMDRLADKRYGRTLYIYWYSVLYLTKQKDRYIPIYLKFTFIRAADGFQLIGAKFNTDLDAIGLP